MICTKVFVINDDISMDSHMTRNPHISNFFASMQQIFGKISTFIWGEVDEVNYHIPKR